MTTYRFREKYGAMVSDLIRDYEEQTGQSYIMGPDAVCLLELLCDKMSLKPGMRILDMGCGAGFTSIILAKEYGVTVFANDLWFPANDNYTRFVKAGVDDRVFPIQAEAHSLPYASAFFDAAISIDAYHYFGTDELYLPQHYARLVKPGGQFGLVLPALTPELPTGLPEAMAPHWALDMYTWHSTAWWHNMWQKTNLVDVTLAEDLADGKALWRATSDYELHDADTENYLTLMRMTALRK